MKYLVEYVIRVRSDLDLPEDSEDFEAIEAEIAQRLRASGLDVIRVDVNSLWKDTGE